MSSSGCCNAPRLSGGPVIERVGSGGKPTTIVWTRAAVRRAESATSTVRLKVPSAEGVPPTMPDDPLSASPVGSDPLETRQEYGGRPPVAWSVKLYGAPAVASGKDAGVANVSPWPMAIVKGFWEVTDALSVSVTVKLKLPAVVGVPLSD